MVGLLADVVLAQGGAVAAFTNMGIVGFVGTICILLVGLVIYVLLSRRG